MRIFSILLPIALFGCRGGGEVVVIDADEDGFNDQADCNDADPAIFPGAAETCDGVDSNCNGLVDDQSTDAPTWYADADGDGHGGSGTTTSCDQPTGYVAEATDCNDGDADSGRGRGRVHRPQRLQL